MRKYNKIVTFKNIMGEWVAADGIYEVYADTEDNAIKLLKLKRKGN